MGRKIPVVLDDDERRALLAVPNTRYPTGQRNLCMLRVMLDLGLRVSEVANLKVKDVNWTTGRNRAQLIVRQGKGGKDRVLRLSDDDMVLLCTWRDRRRVDGDYLFTTLQGGQLSTRYIRAMVERCSIRAGIDKKVGPHTLRHTFATDFYRENRNLVAVQAALGHSNITTTSIYTHLVNGELEDALRFFRAGAVTA